MSSLWRFAAPVVAMLAIFFLPAMRVSAPMMPPQEWTVAGLGAEAIRSAPRPSGRGAPNAGDRDRQSVRSILHQARELRRELGSNVGGAKPASWRLKLVMALAGLVPVAAVIAGICAVLSLLFAGFEWRRWVRGTAVAGLVASAYAIGVSWWMTQAARADLEQILHGVEQRYGGLLTAILGRKGLASLERGLTQPLGLTPEVGLYVLLLAFVAMLLLPGAPELGNKE